MISFNIKVKIAYKEKKGQWEVSTEEPSLKEVSTELPTALRTLQAKLSKALEELPTTNRVILTLNEIKVSGSTEIDYEGLRTGGQVFFDIEDMRVSTSFTVTFSPDRTLESFDERSPEDQDKIRNLHGAIMERSKLTGEDPHVILENLKKEAGLSEAGSS